MHQNIFSQDWGNKLVKTSDEFVISFTKNTILASLEIISPHFGGCSKRNDAREHLPQLRGHATIIRNEETYRDLSKYFFFSNLCVYEL